MYGQTPLKNVCLYQIVAKKKQFGSVTFRRNILGKKKKKQQKNTH